MGIVNEKLSGLGFSLLVQQDELLLSQPFPRNEVETDLNEYYSMGRQRTTRKLTTNHIPSDVTYIRIKFIIGNPLKGYCCRQFLMESENMNILRSQNVMSLHVNTIWKLINKWICKIYNL